jgi:hypothetical protein
MISDLYSAIANTTTDCAEKEATYIITTGGINDPDKA